MVEPEVRMRWLQVRHRSQRRSIAWRPTRNRPISRVYRLHRREGMQSLTERSAARDEWTAAQGHATAIVAGKCGELEPISFTER